MPDKKDTLARQIAEILLEIKAVVFDIDNPITFKSGILSPVYVNNRVLPTYPQQWEIVMEGFHTLINTDKLQFEVIAGMEVSGIPHSAVLGYTLRMPSIFVRKQPKKHGTHDRVEGGNIDGKRVVIIEDAITTGGTVLSSVQALREVGATVTDCLSITTYGFKEAADAFTEAGVTPHVLTSFETIWQIARHRGIITPHESAQIGSWYQNPNTWRPREA